MTFGSLSNLPPGVTDAHPHFNPTDDGDPVRGFHCPTCDHRHGSVRVDGDVRWEQCDNCGNACNEDDGSDPDADNSDRRYGL